VRISIFTPSHNPLYLNECYESLRAQTFEDWEWLILLNTASSEWSPHDDDPRVTVKRHDRPGKIGALKREACELTSGEILVELDHDDILAIDCLAEIDAAFTSNPNASLVFSDFAQINEDGSPNHDRFNPTMGWVYSEVDVDGTTQLRCHAMSSSPHNASYIWYAPNHVRAFPRAVYDAVGGYNAELSVLDDQDLMMRLFLAGDFHHIEKCLYLQRMHGQNTQRDPSTNAFIQDQTVRYYDERFSEFAAAWSRRRDKAVLTLRTHGSPETSDSDPGEILVIDPANPQLPFDDNSVGVIKAIEILQRIPDRAAFLNECYRVLDHGGVILTETPSTDGRGAFQDPSHVAFYNENSFWYITQERMRSVGLPTLHGRFQVSRIRTYFPTSFDETNNISYVQANLLAIKDGSRQGGPLLC